MSHDDDKRLEWARFDVTKQESAVESTIKLARASADYNYRMMEVLEKRVKIAGDKLKLDTMQDAFERFKEARQRSLAKAALFEKRAAAVKTHARYLLRVAQGETISPTSIVHVWSGFYFFLDALEPAAEARLDELVVGAEHRAATNFAHPTLPGDICRAAPAETEHVRQLIQFCRSRNYIPKLRSPAIRLVYRVVEILDDVAGSTADRLGVEADGAAAEAKRLGEADYALVNINVPPRG